METVLDDLQELTSKIFFVSAVGGSANIEYIRSALKDIQQIGDLKNI